MFSGTGQDVDENVERRDGKKEKDKGYVAFFSDDDDVGAQGDDESLAASSAIIRTKTKKSKKEKSVKKESKKKSKTKKQEKGKVEKEKEKVKEKDKKKDKKTESPKHQQALPVFGVTIEEAVQRSMLPDGVQLPRIIRECIIQLEDKGLSQEGIYRLSGVKSKIEQLKELYNQGKNADLDEFEPNILAGLIKLFIRELTDSILPEEIAQRFEEAAAIPNRQEKISQFKKLIPELPVPNKTLLSWLMVHMLHVLQKGPENKMSIQSIGIVLHPTTGIAQPVLNVLLNNVSTLFGETQLTRYEHSVKPEVDISSLSTPEEIAAELTRQEEILAKLHEDMKKGTPDETEDKDEELWEVQRKVTMLKRKLRVAKRKQDAEVVEEQKKQEENKPPTQEDGEEETLKRLELEEMELRFEEEELLDVREQLERRLQNEKSEINRLEEEIAEVNETRVNNSGVASDQNSSSASDDSESEDDDESELEEIMNELVKHNTELEEKNEKLFKQIHDEQETCVELKVQIRMVTATQKEETEKPSS